MCAGFTFSDVFHGYAVSTSIFFFGDICAAGGREIDGGSGGVGEGVLWA
jgi:hypothetical protein